MRGATCFSGIGAPEIAMPHIDWIWHSEIEPFPCAVMAARHPNNQNLGDILAPDFIERAKALGRLDIMVGGPPCQAFSIAGLRGSLSDPRGNLSLRWVQVLHAIRPSIAVTENVPGWLSTADNAFGCFLAGIVGADAPLNSPLERGRWPNHGMVSGPLARAAWRVLDAQYVRTRSFPWAVPQRRRRVFVVISFGATGIDPAAVLFDRESLRGNPAPRREAGESTPANAGSGAASGGGSVGSAFRCQNEQAGIVEDDCAASLRAKGTTTDERSVGAYVAAARMVAFGESVDDGAASAMKARDFKDATDLVAHALRGEGFDASEDGTGRGTPIVPVAIHSDAIGRDGISKTAGADAAGVVRKHDAGLGIIDDGSVYSLTTGQPHVVAFTAKDHGGDAVENISPTLRAGGHTGSHANAGVMPAIAYTADGLTGDPLTASSDRSYTNEGNNFRLQNCVDQAWGARRLTPTECARLQGFPDDWARIPWRGKPAEECPDGPQYKALGNSIAVNVISFIGERIEAVRAAELKGGSADVEARMAQGTDQAAGRHSAGHLCVVRTPDASQARSAGSAPPDHG